MKAVYIADDGTQFDNPKSCQDYEMRGELIGKFTEKFDEFIGDIGPVNADTYNSIIGAIFDNREKFKRDVLEFDVRRRAPKTPAQVAADAAEAKATQPGTPPQTPPQETHPTPETPAVVSNQELIEELVGGLTIILNKRSFQNPIYTRKSGFRIGAANAPIMPISITSIAEALVAGGIKGSAGDAVLQDIADTASQYDLEGVVVFEAESPAPVKARAVVTKANTFDDIPPPPPVG